MTDLVALKSEIQNDPAGIGYTSPTDYAGTAPNFEDAAQGPNGEFGHAHIANLMNAASQTVKEDRLSVDDFISNLDADEYRNLPLEDRQYVDLVARLPSINTRQGGVRAGLLAVFTATAGPNTRANLNAAISRAGARWEVLMEAEPTKWTGPVSPSEVSNALRLP